MSHILSVYTGVTACGIPIPMAVPLPTAPSVLQGRELKPHIPAQFLLYPHKEAQITSSDTEEDCGAGTVVAESSNHTSASKTLAAKPVCPAHIPVLDPKLRLSTSKVKYSSLPICVITQSNLCDPHPVLSRALVCHGVAIILLGSRRGRVM